MSTERNNEDGRSSLERAYFRTAEMCKEVALVIIAALNVLFTLASTSVSSWEDMQSVTKVFSGLWASWLVNRRTG